MPHVHFVCVITAETALLCHNGTPWCFAPSQLTGVETQSNSGYAPFQIAARPCPGLVLLGLNLVEQKELAGLTFLLFTGYFNEMQQIRTSIVQDVTCSHT